MELLEITIYYLEMRAFEPRTINAPREGLSVLHVPAPSIAYYRALYDAVGNPYRWLSRRRMSDPVLAQILQNPHTEMYVLFVDDQRAGFAELDRSQPGDVELVQFGLVPEFIGQGLGKWFLQQTIDRAWSQPVNRCWLHTCTLDHPAALPNYRRAGFELYHQETVLREY